MSIVIESLWEPGAVLGESPIWDPRDQSLTWIDIKGHRLHRLDRDGGRRTCPLPGLLSCIALAEEGGIVGAYDRSVVRIDLPQSGSPTFTAVAEAPPAPATSRFNDGKVAPDGAFWVGTMDNEEKSDFGTWLRCAADGSVKLLDAGYRVTNGPTFDARRRRGYLTDSGRQIIYALDGWGENACSDKRILRTFEPDDGYPDGMTIDSEGVLWVAFWDGGCVRALHPTTGETLRQIDLPVRRPTSCVFGGSNFDHLYVTSASIGLEGSDPQAGALFVVRGLGVAGTAPDLFGR